MMCECNDVKCIHHRFGEECHRESFYYVRDKEGNRKRECRMCSFDAYKRGTTNEMPAMIRRLGKEG
jgi:hypothetical protein